MAYNTYSLTTLTDRLTDKWAGSIFWTEAEVPLLLNEALRVWNSLTGFWKRRVTIETQANAFEYPLPDIMTFGMRVEYNGRTLSKATMQSMDAARPSWTNETTAMGGGVPTTVRHWIPMAIDLIAIWPADATGDAFLTVDGVSATPILFNDVDTIDIGDEHLNVILGYALHIAALKEGGERFAATMPYYTAFLKAAAEENTQLKQSQQFRQAIGLNTDKIQYPTRGGATKLDQLVT